MIQKLILPAWLQKTLLLLIILLSSLVYLPGINGPFVFDDHPNIVNNDYVKITSIDKESLYHAAYSLKSGPLQRPVAMLSFAINYYFAQSFRNTRPYKLTNIIIHALNGILIFFLLRLLLGYIVQKFPDAWPGSPSAKILTLLSLAIALLWVVHPIQLTSVLYIVQRMTTLSAFFVLLSLVSYVYGRLLIVTTDKRLKGYIFFAGIPVFGALGVLSKENAVLLPVFILAIEFVVFHKEKPWSEWHKLPRRYQYSLIFILVVLAATLFSWVLQYAMTGYPNPLRNFTMMERLLTESRVLFYYISLIVAPRINELSLFHDDFIISRSIFFPWTTILSTIGIAALFIGSIVFRRYLLLSLGILWFLTGHLIESTVFALEPIHEHRNYLASLGIIIIMVYTIAWLQNRSKIRTIWLFLPLLIIVCSAGTVIRSNQWSSYYSLYYIESINKPRSARAQAAYAVSLHRLGKYKESIDAARKAAQLNPAEPGHYINMHLSAYVGKIKLPDEDVLNTIKKIKKYPDTILLSNALYKIHQCLLGPCRGMAPTMEKWLRILQAKNKYPVYDFMFGRVLRIQGRYKEAIFILERSHNNDKRYMHPLFELAGLYLDNGQLNKAEETLLKLKKANIGNPHPRNMEIAVLEKKIMVLRRARSHKK